MQKESELKNNQKFDTQDDLVVVVDKSDKILEYVPRKEAHKKNIMHRTTVILVFNKEGKLLLQKRTRDKDTYPGFYTVSAGGHVLKGQDYKEAAERELYEELMISGKLEYIDTFLVPEGHITMTAAFKLKSDGPFNFNTYEIEKVEFFDVKKIKEIKDNLTPQARIIFTNLGYI